MIALAAVSGSAAAVPQPSPIDQDGEGIAARHLARLRSVFRDAYGAEVLVSAIVYSSGHPEHMVGLRRSGESFEVFGTWPSQQIWDYGQVEMFRSRAVRVLEMHRGGRMEDRSDEEADRLASTLPANPLDLQLSRCAIPISADLAGAIRTTWESALVQLPRAEPTGSPGIFDKFLIRAGSEEREVVYSQWRVGEDTPDQHLMELTDSMYLDCRTPDEAGRHVRETLANQRRR
jgi:hypothetical protein